MNFKKIFPITLLLWPYLMIFILLAGLVSPAALLGVSLVYTLMTFAVYILNIIHAWTYKSEDSYKNLAFWNMLIKLVYIPFYIIIFIIEMCLLVSIFFVGAGRDYASELVVCALYLMVVPSMYGVSAVVQARKRGLVSTTYAVVHSILHFILVADLISAVILYAKLEKVYRTQKQYQYQIPGQGGMYYEQRG